MVERQGEWRSREVEGYVGQVWGYGFGPVRGVGGGEASIQEIGGWEG